MDDSQPQFTPEGPDPREEGYGLTRRDFLKAAAILTGSTLVLLSRCSLPYNSELPPIPPDFKRFILTEQSPSVATEQIIVALGAQCPDLKCTLWWGAGEEFLFFESVDQINQQYMESGRNKLFWLD